MNRIGVLNTSQSNFLAGVVSPDGEYIYFAGTDPATGRISVTKVQRSTFTVVGTFISATITPDQGNVAILTNSTGTKVFVFRNHSSVTLPDFIVITTSSMTLDSNITIAGTFGLQNAVRIGTKIYILTKTNGSDNKQVAVKRIDEVTYAVEATQAVTAVNDYTQFRSGVVVNGTDVYFIGNQNYIKFSTPSLTVSVNKSIAPLRSALDGHCNGSLITIGTVGSNAIRVNQVTQFSVSTDLQVGSNVALSSDYGSFNVNQAGTKAFFGLFAAPANVKQFDIATAVIDDTLGLNAGDGPIHSAAAWGNTFYFGTFENPCEIIKVSAAAALTISNVSVTSGQTSVTITWDTSVAASSQIDYGLTAGYGSQTALDPTLVTSHSVEISGLIAGTTYHYRINGTDIDFQTASTSDATFSTIGGTGYSAVSSCYGQDANGNFFVICGDYRGRLWKLEQDELSDNGFGYKSVFITPSMTFGNPRVNKKFVRAHIVNGIVNASTITVKVFIDGVLRQTTTLDIDPQGMVFGSIVFGQSVFSEGELVPPVSTPIGFIGSRIRFEIYNAVSGEEFFVTQLLVDYKELGPKAGWSE